MAIVTRYFSTTSAGDRDGTTWANRAALFVSTIAVNSATWSGALSPGETVTQTGTGATAVVELAGGSGNIMAVSSVMGSPNNSGVWTGGTSGNTVTPTATPITGAWSPAITRFDFSGLDSLTCLVGPGAYTCAQTLSEPLFTNPSNMSRRLLIAGCNSSGTPEQAKTWVSSQPFESVTSSNWAIIQTNTNIVTINLSTACVDLYRMAFTATACNNYVISHFVDSKAIYCFISNSFSGASASGIQGQTIVDSCVELSGTNYGLAFGHNSNRGVINCRAQGNAAATSGSRTAFSATIGNFTNCTAINFAGGFINSSTLTQHQSQFEKCIAINCTTGFRRFNLSSLGTIVNFSASSCYAVNCTTGFESLGNHIWLAVNNLSKCITNYNFGDYGVGVNNNISSGTDADEFVNPSIGDYRIKRTSSLWGKGLGPGDEPTPAQAYLLLART